MAHDKVTKYINSDKFLTRCEIVNVKVIVNKMINCSENDSSCSVDADICRKMFQDIVLNVSGGKCYARKTKRIDGVDPVIVVPARRCEKSRWCPYRKRIVMKIVVSAPIYSKGIPTVLAGVIYHKESRYDIISALAESNIDDVLAAIKKRSAILTEITRFR